MHGPGAARTGRALREANEQATVGTAVRDRNGRQGKGTA